MLQTAPQDRPLTGPQDEIIVDGARLRRALRRQGRLWLWLGPAAAVAGALLLGAVAPRSYTATTSVALQQSSGSSSALSLLTGGGGASKRYLGVLKSRALAESVEHRVQLRQLYGAKTFRTEDDAVEFLTKSVKPDDSATDGLLYVAVTLPGPPKFALHSSPSVSQVEAASADAANAYARALRTYYANSDTDQGVVLLRGADKEVREARSNYSDALNRLLDFTRSLNGIDPRSAPSASGAPLSGSSAPGASVLGGGAGSGTDSATAASGLGGLYAAQNQVEAELRSVKAAQAAGQALVGGQLRDLSSVPTDDPLLANARARVTSDHAAYDTASRLYGPDNPAVVTAQTRLQVDQAELDKQIQGVRRSLTTPDIRTTEQIQGLNARQFILLQQIAAAEKHLGVSRKLSGESGRLQAEVGIQLDVLRTTLTEAAKIRLDNASSLNRMTVVDPAVPPKNGEPGLSKLAAACVVLTFLAFLAAVVRDYFRDAPRKAPGLHGAPLPVSGNGSDGNGAGGAVIYEDAEAVNKTA